MHNRRLGAFLLGAWLVGSVLAWSTASHARGSTDRLLNMASAEAQQHLATMGRGMAAEVLRHQAMEVKREVVATWRVLQLALAGALLAVSVFTSHRSRTTIAAGMVMAAVSAAGTFYITPAVNGLGRSLDFVPAGGAVAERAAYASLEVWDRVLEIIATLAAALAASRLLFDFRDMRESLTGRSRPAVIRTRHARVQPEAEKI